MIRAPGSPTNRTNWTDASGLYPALDEAPCSPRPAPRYRSSPYLQPLRLENVDRDLASTPDLAPTGKTQKLSKNECPFTPPSSEVNTLDRNNIYRVFNRVQLIHRLLPKFGATCCTQARAFAGSAQFMRPPTVFCTADFLLYRDIFMCKSRLYPLFSLDS